MERTECTVWISRVIVDADREKAKQAEAGENFQGNEASGKTF